MLKANKGYAVLMELPQVGILREVNNDRLNVGIMVDAE
jgi:hypothetical protein